MSDVVGRYAPSPSGRMHLGNLFSAFLAWASARSQDGTFLLRLEDIDERCRKPENSQMILEDLKWLGIDWDGQVIQQTKRFAAYEEALETLRQKALVYPCFCSRADIRASSAPHLNDGQVLYAGTCKGLSQEKQRLRAETRQPALRIEVPNQAISFMDVNLGLVSQDLSTECGDFIIRRSDGIFAYQLVVVVDDAFSGVTEVVRGLDLASSAPRQIWLYGLLGEKAPRYGHHPVLVAADGKRLSKREKSLDVGALKEAFDGKSESILGWIGWLAGLLPEAEPVSAQELLGEFSWNKVKADNVTVNPFGPIEFIS